MTRDYALAVTHFSLLFLQNARIGFKSGDRLGHELVCFGCARCVIGLLPVEGFRQISLLHCWLNWQTKCFGINEPRPHPWRRRARSLAHCWFSFSWVSSIHKILSQNLSGLSLYFKFQRGFPVPIGYEWFASLLCGIGLFSHVHDLHFWRLLVISQTSGKTSIVGCSLWSPRLTSVWLTTQAVSWLSRTFRMILLVMALIDFPSSPSHTMACSATHKSHVRMQVTPLVEISSKIQVWSPSQIDNVTFQIVFVE